MKISVVSSIMDVRGKQNEGFDVVILGHRLPEGVEPISHIYIMDSSDAKKLKKKGKCDYGNKPDHGSMLWFMGDFEEARTYVEKVFGGKEDTS